MHHHTSQLCQRFFEARVACSGARSFLFPFPVVSFEVSLGCLSGRVSHFDRVLCPLWQSLLRDVADARGYTPDYPYCSADCAGLSGTLWVASGGDRNAAVQVGDRRAAWRVESGVRIRGG
jgi:hypothetical protein